MRRPGQGAGERYRDDDTSGNSGGDSFFKLPEDGDSATMAFVGFPFETYFGKSRFQDNDGNDKPSTVVNYPVATEGSDDLRFWGAGRAGQKAVDSKIRALAKKAARKDGRDEPSADDYASAEADVYGHWLEVTRQGKGPTTTYTLELGDEFTQADREAALDRGAGLLESLLARAGESANDCEADGFRGVARRIRERLADYDAGSATEAGEDHDDIF